ncbi:MAG: phytoene/squalene synthase family protein [Pseudomonadota bacterium]
MLLNSSDAAGAEAETSVGLGAPALSAAARFEADLEACRELIRTGSHSFYAASRLLPSRVRRPAFALYAFCRLTDDAVDLDADGMPRGEVRTEADQARARATLERLHERLDLVYAGRPIDEPADRAFAAAVAHFEIPKTLPAALLDGYAWDLAGRRYETLSEVRAYSARVAGSVGAMMSVLMGARSGPMLARACDLATAMQLTNIARDVGEDARAGRLYLPRAWMAEAGLDPDAWLAKPRFSKALGSVIARLLAEADRLYIRSEAGIAALPVDCRPAIYAARYIYAEIGREVARAGFDSVAARASTSTATKLLLIGRSLRASVTPRPWDSSPALSELAYLVDAAAISERDAPEAGGDGMAAEAAVRAGAWPPDLAQLDRVLDVFVRLSQEDSERRALQQARGSGRRAVGGGPVGA